MPIKPPRLDDRAYDDIVREARALIPQYTPEWTHLGDSDPGMTLVQLFAWMTEMTLYRLNRVPDKTYVHFLNFIGEERKTAAPASVPVTFTIRADERKVLEIPAHARCSTRQADGSNALHYLTTAPVTVHSAKVDRILSVAAGEEPMVRELPFANDEDVDHAVLFGAGSGVQLFQLDEIDDGPNAYTADQFVYVRHADFAHMGVALDDEEAAATDNGTLRIRSVGDPGMPVAALFDWEHPSSADAPWRPIELDESQTQDVMGLPEVHLQAKFAALEGIEALGDADDPVALPDNMPGTGWIRGRVRYERWLSRLMEDELRITWRDDRGAEEREITNWLVRDVGRTLEFFVQNLPPIRGGWLLRFTMVDHGLPTGRKSYFPLYRWSYRRGDRWIPIRRDRVESQGATIVISGPLTDMATDGFNLRAERAEVLHLEGLLPGMQSEIVWRRPIDLHLASGPDDDGAAFIQNTSLPVNPFQPLATLPAMLGMKFYLGSDLLANRMRSTVVLELEIGFEREGELVEEPVQDYHLQLTYRTAEGWQVVHPLGDLDWTRFTFSDLDPDGAGEAQRRRVRIVIDPREQLAGLARAVVATRDTHWLRLELTRAALTTGGDNRTAEEPISLRVYGISFGIDGRPGVSAYDEPMPGSKILAVEHRPANRRFTRVFERVEGEVRARCPFDDVIEIDDDVPAGHRAIYLRFDKPLPRGARHAILYRCRGETFLPRGFSVYWELLQESGRGGRKWVRVASSDEPEQDAYAFDRTGVLAFQMDEDMRPAPEGVWLRGVMRHDGDGPFPALPPVTHMLLNSVEATNLHGFRMEKFSGEGIPHQTVQLRHYPVFLRGGDDPRDRYTDLRVHIEDGKGERQAWRLAVGNSLSTATKDDRVFIVDPVDGTLTFGNGIRGKIPPVGTFNIVVESYHTVPGAAGNVAAGAVEIAESYNDVVEVHNLLPANGGRNAESIEEIIRRAPSILTSRDRAVTRGDFVVIAEEASSEVARAACGGTVGADGGIEVVILPRKRANEVVPDPFVAAGLKDHVQRYLAKRCLVNVRPRVRLATFRTIDVSVRLRLRRHANPILVREQVMSWIRTFLDPYNGGLDSGGWPFGATLYAQDFGRVVTDIDEVRHVVDVDLFAVEDLDDAPGWQRIPGLDTGDQVMPLEGDDLFRTREVRVQFAEERA
jgi:hypothetical protein